MRIDLKGTQRVGLEMFIQKIEEKQDEIRQIQKEAGVFVKLALEENGGDPKEPWQWDEAQRAWMLPDPPPDSDE